MMDSGQDESGWLIGSLAAHITRGAIAGALLTWAVLHQSSQPTLAVAAGVAAVVAMRGCPLCWTLDLFAIVAGRIRGRRSAPSTASPAGPPSPLANGRWFTTAAPR
jgi:hypothetical protein